MCVTICILLCRKGNSTKIFTKRGFLTEALFLSDLLKADNKLLYFLGLLKVKVPSELLILFVNVECKYLPDDDHNCINNQQETHQLLA